MSKTYTCKVKIDLREEVREEDRIVYKPILLPVASQEKLRQWIREALLDDGATVNADGTLSLEIEGVRVEIDLEKDQVEARIIAESSEDIHIEKDEERKVFDIRDDEEKARKTARDQVAEEAAGEMSEAREAARAQLREKARETLREASREVKRRVRTAVNIAIEKGLDETAHELGDVQDKEEAVDPKGDHRLVWRIRLRN